MNEVRALFPGAQAGVYMDSAVRGLLSVPVREAVERYLDLRTAGLGKKGELHAAAEAAREGFAALVGAQSDEIALTKNVSEGLNLFAASLPWLEGDNVVVCPELEHPNNVFLWYNLRRLRGIEVRVVEPDGGRVPTERMAAAVDERTRLATAPQISFAPGFITDLGPLRAATRDHGALLLLDSAQAIGAVETNVRDLDVDALAVATQKCLLAFYGLGFLYVRSEVAEELVPWHVARYGIDLGDAHETAIGTGELHYQHGARRFDLGNFNYLGASAAVAAMELIGSIGMERVEAHLNALAVRLAEGFLDLHLPVVGGSPGPHLAHIVSVGRSGGGRHATADDPAMNALHAHLESHGVRLSIRRGVLRFSLGIYNDENDVDRVLALTREWQESAPKTKANGP